MGGGMGCGVEGGEAAAVGEGVERCFGGRGGLEGGVGEATQNVCHVSPDPIPRIPGYDIWLLVFRES